MTPPLRLCLSFYNHTIRPFSQQSIKFSQIFSCPKILLSTQYRPFAYLQKCGIRCQNQGKLLFRTLLIHSHNNSGLLIFLNKLQSRLEVNRSKHRRFPLKPLPAGISLRLLPFYTASFSTPSSNGKYLNKR